MEAKQLSIDFIKKKLEVSQGDWNPVKPEFKSNKLPAMGFLAKGLKNHNLFIYREVYYTTVMSPKCPLDLLKILNKIISRNEHYTVIHIVSFEPIYNI